MGTLAHAGRLLAVEAAADIADNRPIRHQFDAGTEDAIGRGRPQAGQQPDQTPIRQGAADAEQPIGPTGAAMARPITRPLMRNSEFSTESFSIAQGATILARVRAAGQNAGTPIDMDRLAAAKGFAHPVRIMPECR